MVYFSFMRDRDRQIGPQVQHITLNSHEFDVHPEAATAQVRMQGEVLRDGLNQVGIDVRALTKKEPVALKEAAQERFGHIHDAAALVHMQWEKARQEGNKDGEFAAAKLFNTLTMRARELNEQHHIVDTS